MDGGTASSPASHPEGGPVAALVAAADEIETAAWREGIDRDDPLGVWVQSLRHALVALATMVHGEGQTVAGVLAETRKTVEAELLTLHVANETARTVLAQARSLSSALEQQSRASEVRTFEHLVDKMCHSLTAALRKAIVIREERYNRMKLSWFGATVAGLALCLVIGGYQWCAYENRAAISLLNRCLVHSVENTITHRPFCQLTE